METEIKILNEEGLHARPAGVFVKAASQFTSKIEVEFNGAIVNAKSIMTLMSLGLKKEDTIKIKADGTDASEAIEALVNLVKNKFQS